MLWEAVLLFTIGRLDTLWQPKNSPDIAKCTLGSKIILVDNHCSQWSCKLGDVYPWGTWRLFKGTHCHMYNFKKKATRSLYFHLVLLTINDLPSHMPSLVIMPFLSPLLDSSHNLSLWQSDKIKSYLTEKIKADLSLIVIFTMVHYPGMEKSFRVEASKKNQRCQFQFKAQLQPSISLKYKFLLTSTFSCLIISKSIRHYAVLTNYYHF